jgi:hypothetical protein
MSPEKAIEILTGLVNNAWPLKNEPWGSPKRKEWAITARGVLERAFSPGSSIVQEFDAANSFGSFDIDSSDEEMRRLANSSLDSKLAILRSAMEQLNWEAADEPAATTQRQAVEVGKKSLTEKSASGIGSLDILREAIKAVPAVKYALGVAGIASAITIVVGFRLDLRIAVFGTPIMVMFMTLLVLFARLAKMTPSKFMRPALVFTWSVVVITIATVTLLLTSVFWRWPMDFQNWLRSGASDTANIEKPRTNMSIAGIVVDQDTNQGVGQATIVIAGRTEEYVTEDSGNFRIDLRADAPKRLRIHVSKSGFRPLDTSVEPPAESLVLPLHKR